MQKKVQYIGERCDVLLFCLGWSSWFAAYGTHCDPLHDAVGGVCQRIVPEVYTKLNCKSECSNLHGKVIILILIMVVGFITYCDVQT